MFLHYGFSHAQPIVLAGVGLLAFAAGLLLGTYGGEDADADADPAAE